MADRHKQLEPLPLSLGFAALKAKHRALRDGFPQSVSLRVHRALSWLQRAEAESEDHDVRFILLWIGFNAAYSAHVRYDTGEREEFRAFFETLIELDAGHRIYKAVWERFSQEIRLLLDNRYVFAPFWAHFNGEPDNADWEERLLRSKKAINVALAKRDTPRILSILFDRLYVLRNQLVHGGATWNGAVNRAQVHDGAALLGCLLPLFVDIIMDHPGRDWGRPFYPVVED